MKLGAIVEGHGEVQALRVLVQRVLAYMPVALEIVDVLPPLRVKRQGVIRAGELERAIELLSVRVGSDGAILVLLDSDADCAATVGPQLLARAQKARSDRRIRVVFAVHEYEAWLLGSIEQLRGYRGVPPDAASIANPEMLASPKARLAELMNGYQETTDQPALTAQIDVAVLRQVCPSFDKLVRDLLYLVRG